MPWRAQSLADLLVAYRAAGYNPFAELRALYPARFAPPAWPIGMRHSDLSLQSLESVRVYHDADFTVKLSLLTGLTVH